MSEFDWDQAIDKAREPGKWTTGFVHKRDGSECAIGILASVAGMEMGTSIRSDAACQYVADAHPEVIGAVYAVLDEQESDNMEDCRDLEMADDGIITTFQKAAMVVAWNDGYCHGGERLATYLEKARALEGMTL